MSFFDRMLVAMMPLVPKAIVGRVARRYVAGETLDDALATIKRVQDAGACATVDVLGEEIERIEESYPTRDAYLELLDRIQAQGLDANVSVKLTAFGLRQNADICFENVRAVVEKARSQDNFVRIDMEDSSVTSDTLAIFRRLRDAGYGNVGVVLQAYLRRTMEDVAAFSELNPNYRICKGIYVEREEVALQGAEEINQNYLAILDDMLERGSYVGIATHHHGLVDGAKEIIARRALAREAYEFQMLLGVDEGLGRRLIEEKHRLRIYIPYGERWYEYCLRRLKENPRIGRYVFLALFKGSKR